MTKLYLVVFAFCLLFSGIAMPVEISATDLYGDGALASFKHDDLAGCRVSTRSGNLNVRNNAGNVIAKLRNGLSVRVVTDDGDRFLISAYVGRRTIRGWVSSEFITCN